MSHEAKRRKMTTHQDQVNALVANNYEFRPLPELLKMILQKVVLVQMYSKDTAKHQRDKTIFSNLASVDFRWWCSMKKCNLRNKIRHHSKVYFQRIKMRSTIIRNNRNFLKEVIDPDKIIFPLKSCGCLTEDQVTFLTRLKSHKDKNLELLFMLQDASSQKYSKFVDCLFATNQTPAALVLERGGEAVKVHINYGRAARTKDFEMELIERFQRMQTENTLILNDSLNAAVKERLNDVFIIHAKQNKGIELWVWCKTKRSLNEMKRLSEEDIQEIIQRLIQEHSTLLEPQFIQMNYCLDNDFAERRLSIRHVGDRGNLKVVRYSCVTDVSQHITSLADKLYVAQKISEISVYWNKYPFNSLKSIVLNYAGYPMQIASCKIKKCIYVFLSSNSYILKVEPMLDNRVSEWLRHETGLFLISVIRRGDVLVLVSRGGHNELRIIAHEGTVKRTISIPECFSLTQFIQEIMPDIVALSYVKLSTLDISHIAIMRLDENGTVLRNIEWHETISGLSSFRYGDLFIGFYEPGSDNLCLKVQHWTLESKVARDLLTTDDRMISIHFDADQQQLYVLSPNKLDIYHLHYEDEVHN